LRGQPGALEPRSYHRASEIDVGAGQGLGHLRPASRPRQPVERVAEGAIPLVSTAHTGPKFKAAPDKAPDSNGFTRDMVTVGWTRHHTLHC
jgi:hypothetical protein